MWGVILAITIAATPPADAQLAARLNSTATAYYSSLAAIAPIGGRADVYDYYQRLIEDQGYVEKAATTQLPEGFTRERYLAFVEDASSLDIEVAKQLIDRAFVPMASVRGLHEVFVKSSVDGTMQPAAVYVPASYRSDKPISLVVFLHGQPQTESQLTAPWYIRELADSIGSIIVAPYGRAAYDYRGVAASDVYDALEEAQHSFTIDRRKTYLVGYSMGGFSVFEVAPLHASAWSAVMCISGGLLGHDARIATQALARTPLYVLTGDHDTSISSEYTTRTAAYLASTGADVSYYRQPGGTHHLPSLMPILNRAWNDMHDGTIRSAPPQLGSIFLPPSAPEPVLKP